ncbi:MAG: hypothetical protein VCA12_14880, partial [Pseudomonadales bacterium]
KKIDVTNSQAQKRHYRNALGRHRSGICLSRFKIKALLLRSELEACIECHQRLKSSIIESTPSGRETFLLLHSARGGAYVAFTFA